ncbi:Arg-Lys translocation region protein phosphatase [Leptospira ryugenii]|uniref:Arg-Lys translocation region protein phosphatase n=1 Tax=Leptospira ryugenii TaxID=1917863 RepID=A0A2P2E0S0_9LEPT|nr:Arg-Lys translocation region protein phosphatase RktP [Leptospira ryugenii]GBF50484.1 Arg-Lys translocation region protein phosphatase [Leptospira ryugenii]
MYLNKIHLRIKIPFVLFIFAFFLFISQFLIGEFILRNFQNPAGKEQLSVRLLGVYLSLVYSGVMAGLLYFLLGFVYRSFKKAAAEIQETDLDHLPEENTEEVEFLRTLKRSLFQAQSTAEFHVESTKQQWEEQKSMFIHRLLPDRNLEKISGWDISIFPSLIQTIHNDYIHIIKTTDGFVGILAGFVETTILESSQKLFIHGLLSAHNHSHLSTVSLLEKLEDSLHLLSLNQLKLSLFGMGEERDKLHFYHFMDMPIFQFSKQGIQVIEGSGDDSWHALHPHHLSIADGIEIGDYLVWGTDRALKEFSMTSFELMEEFVDYLLDLQPESSRKMLLAIAKKLSELGKQKNLIHPLDNLSIIVVRRTR